MGKKRFTTIFWDVDDTLLDFEYSMRQALKACFREFDLELTEEMILLYEKINEGYWKKLEKGLVTKELLLTGRFRDFFEELKITHIDVPKFLASYQVELGNHYQFLDDSLTICKALQTKFKQYALTNGVAHTQENKLKRSGLYEVMDGIFISEKLGSNKPSKEFFEGVFEQIEEQDRGSILMIGDSLSSDILGAMNVGIATCWYNPSGKEAPADYRIDFEIVDLHQVYEVLGIFE